VQSGHCGVGNDASSIPRDATGFYFKATGTTGTPQIKQIVDISGYIPRKYRAHRLLPAQPQQRRQRHATVTLDPLDSNNNILAARSTRPSWRRRPSGRARTC
jgi:hypothetical protein